MRKRRCTSSEVQRCLAMRDTAGREIHEQNIYRAGCTSQTLDVQ